jgi:5-methylcytosine-specific restriction enzyme A
MLLPTAFRKGQTYRRKDVFYVLGLDPHPSGGPWFTGYTSHDGAHFIFCNVGVPGRTGHDYENRWEDADRLRWYGKTGSRADQRQMRAMTKGTDPVFLFYRRRNQDPFTFAGLARAISVTGSQPVEVLWGFAGGEAKIAEEVRNPERFAEGATRRITVNAYERSEEARAECILHHGARCQICGFDFEARYGEIGRGFIHVHHLCSLASIGAEYKVDPVEDLLPVCPNCHAMLHRREPPLSPGELRDLLKPYVAVPRTGGLT